MADSESFRFSIIKCAMVVRSRMLSTSSQTIARYPAGKPTRPASLAGAVVLMFQVWEQALIDLSFGVVILLERAECFEFDQIDTLTSKV